MGFRGSYISDIFFQSIGLISYLVSLTLIFTGINIIIRKDFFLIIENIFYSILYSIFGSVFLNHFYNTTFALFINGNGGFIGNYLNENFFKSLLNLNENISYYFLIILIISLFLLSINFNLKKFFNFLKKINFFNPKINKNYTVEELVKGMSLHWKKVKWKIEKNRSGYFESKLLQLNCHKAKKELNWQPKINFEQLVEMMVKKDLIRLESNG